MAEFKNIIGTDIKISTKTSTFEGYVYTLYSGISEKDCENIALYCPQGKGNNDFTIINLKATQIGNPEFSHKQKEDYFKFPQGIPNINIDKLKQSNSLDLEKYSKYYEKKINDKVEPKIQYLFEEINKLYPNSEWENDAIVITDLKITITSPYKIDNVSGGNEASNKYLRQILSNLWANLK